MRGIGLEGALWLMAERDPATFDNHVRRFVYDHTIDVGLPPTAAEAARSLACPDAAIRSAFHRLADAHMLVLQQDSGEILMANPFSAIPTPFLVQAGDHAYHGSCIWDALGIPAMLKRDASIRTSCGDCGAAVTLHITQGALAPVDAVAHFAIPAAHWWDDIVFN